MTAAGKSKRRAKPAAPTADKRPSRPQRRSIDELTDIGLSLLMALNGAIVTPAFEREGAKEAYILVATLFADAVVSLRRSADADEEIAARLFDLVRVAERIESLPQYIPSGADDANDPILKYMNEHSDIR